MQPIRGNAHVEKYELIGHIIIGFYTANIELLLAVALIFLKVD